MALIACKECGNLCSSQAPNCPRCGAPIKRRTNIVTAGCGCLTFFFFGSMLLSSIVSVFQPIRRESTRPAQLRTASTPSGRIGVSSTIVKAVDGKHRYFFDVRNVGTLPFTGRVTITLHYGIGASKSRDETFIFDSPLESDLGKAAYIDLHTGPPSVHGDAAVSTFSFNALSSDGTVSTGSGTITALFEDLHR
jgi:hypothetical protein